MGFLGVRGLHKVGLMPLTGLVAVVGACSVGAGTPGGTRGPEDLLTETCTSDIDRDGDGLFDQREGEVDSDGDDQLNNQDLDSDNDGLPDAEEHDGDVDAIILDGCTALDTDGDGFPDFLDNDSDNDGLSDREERARWNTDPRNEDSDGDGFTDTAEVATGHSPLDPADGLAEDDYFVLLPEGAKERRELDFATRVRKADVYLLMDRTGSMSGAVSNLKSGLSSMVSKLNGSVDDLGLGVGGYSDFPVGQYGTSQDRPYTPISNIETDPAKMQSAVSKLAANLGGKTWASSTEALYQAATGKGMRDWVKTARCSRGVGHPCFREGALPIMVVFTDTSSRNGPLVGSSDNYNPSDFSADQQPHTYAQTLKALKNIGARTFFVTNGNEVDNPTAQSQAWEWANATGTVSASGQPIHFSINSDGGGLTDSVAEAIATLARETPQDIDVAPKDVKNLPEDIVDPKMSHFVANIIADKALNADGSEHAGIKKSEIFARFLDVPPNVNVRFIVDFENNFYRANGTSNIFVGEFVVRGNGVAELDSRDVVIVVPASSAIVVVD